MSDYADVTDCPTCPQLATDRDDALGEVNDAREYAHRLERLILEHVPPHLSGSVLEVHGKWPDGAADTANARADRLQTDLAEAIAEHAELLAAVCLHHPCAGAWIITEVLTIARAHHPDGHQTAVGAALSPATAPEAQ